MNQYKYLVILLVAVLLLASCSANRTMEMETYLPQKISVPKGVNFEEEIEVAVLSTSEDIHTKSIVQHLQQSLVANIHVTPVALKDFSHLKKDYDFIYLDGQLGEKEIEEVKDELISYVNDGGSLFLSHEYGKQFPSEFTGITRFEPITDKELSFTYPEVRRNLSGLQEVWRTFTDIYGKYQGLKATHHIDFKEGAVIGTATPLVNKGELSLLTAQSYGKGTVIWANKFLPNEQFITRFDLQAENNQKYFHFGYASANYLFRNELMKYIAKEKYGYSIQKAYGTYGRPSLAWQAHYEALYSFVLRDMIKWTELLEKHNQIPTYSIVRGSYNGGQWQETLRFHENIGTNSEPNFVNVEENSFFSAGKVLTTKEDIIRFERYPGYHTFLSPLELPYRAYATVADLNADGKLDLLVGSYNGNVYFMQNAGEAGELLFESPVELKDVHVDQAAAPTVVDWNDNQKDDLIVGNEAGELLLFLNDGKGGFTKEGNITANGNPIKLVGNAAPTAVDWDGDGIIDLLVGDKTGQVYFYKGKETGSIDVSEGIALQSSDGVLQVDSFAAPAVVDWNEDGNLDLLVGDISGEITVFLQQDDGLLVNQGKLTGETKNFFGTNAINVGHFTVPVVVDWNMDGKKDLLTGHLEYGNPYAIDDQLFPYKREFKENIAHSQSKKIPLIPHMYFNENLTDENENHEMEIHRNSFNNLGIPWKEDMGVNHHTWTINKDALQTFKNQQEYGIWWNFGFRPPNVSTAPRDGKEFLMIVPFMLPSEKEDERFSKFILFSPAPHNLNYAQAWDGLAKFDIPLTYFEHIEHSMKPGTKVYKKLIDEINFMNEFREKYKYTFQTEEQMARSFLNTFYGDVHFAATNEGVVVVPDYSNVPEEVKEYEKTLGIKLELGEAYEGKEITTSSMFFYEGNDGYYIGVDEPIKIDFVEKSTMLEQVHFVRSNSPVEIISIEKNVLRLKLATKGMQELEIYSPVKLKVRGKNIKVNKNRNSYSIIHYGDEVEITLTK
ncbi:MAG TPA: VCBS repeat-containing protein [Bacillus bacterium]|nr:VCBS repeat-containing protein [Bacillus sp. (in: firmicutes)]